MDTHCHLEQTEFDSDREEVIRRFSEQGIAAISSAIFIEDYEKNLDISRSNTDVYAAVGLDPMKYVQVDEALEWIHSHSSEVVAIGETGLDHYRERNHAERLKQEIAFVKMIDISSELKLPIQVHSRSAGSAALSVLRKNDARCVHMHAFDGKAGFARNASKELDYYFSIPTTVVRSPQKRKLVKAITLDRLLLETDSPVLSPDRVQRNEPSNLPLALREVASILGREEEELCEIILENSLRLYTKIK
ncbi:MAG: TatD family hydrolase [Candidatus Odinarchaeota archaeon]